MHESPEGPVSVSRSPSKRVTSTHTALILVDLQRCFIDQSSEHSAKEAIALLERLNALAERCREAKVPVILTEHVLRADRSNAGTLPAKVAAVAEGMIDETSERAALHSAVHIDPHDIIVRKPRFSAFAGTDLDLVLRTLGIHTVIVGGIATEICCESTARDAADRGLHVIFLSDGTATGSGHDDPRADQTQTAALARMHAFFADVVSIGDLHFDPA
jgi:nicotinamidase-related amidase